MQLQQKLFIISTRGGGKKRKFRNDPEGEAAAAWVDVRVDVRVDFWALGGEATDLWSDGGSGVP